MVLVKVKVNFPYLKFFILVEILPQILPQRREPLQNLETYSKLSIYYQILVEFNQIERNTFSQLTLLREKKKKKKRKKVGWSSFLFFLLELQLMDLIITNSLCYFLFFTD